MQRTLNHEEAYASMYSCSATHWRVFLTSLSAKMLVRQVAINPRRDSSPDNPNVQRDPNPSRIREISQYVRDPDATFPTAIIVSVSSDQTIISETEIEFRS